MQEYSCSKARTVQMIVKQDLKKVLVTKYIQVAEGYVSRTDVEFLFSAIVFQIL